jgi:hypothetical protein
MWRALRDEDPKDVLGRVDANGCISVRFCVE